MTIGKLTTLLAKLDALAAHPGTPAEGEAACAKAEALRERYADLLPKPAPVPQQPVLVFAPFGYPLAGGMANGAVTHFAISFS